MPPNSFHPDQARETLDLDSLQLLALPQSVRLSRRLVMVRLPQWDLDDLIEKVVLVVSEYATNSVRATGPEQAPDGYVELHDDTPPMFVVRLRRTATHLIAEVGDVSEAPPVPRTAGDDDENGRGLALVRAYADFVGWRRTETGKVVWAAWLLDAVLAQQHPVAVIA